MTITAENSLYVARCSFEERHLPEQAGFSWNMRWTTYDHAIAGKLADYFDAGAKELAGRPALACRAHSDYHVDSPAGKSFLPYQRAGVEYLRGHRHTLLADSMGLGKTIQTIGYINMNPDLFRILIICPATLKGNWRYELQQWLTVPLSIAVLNGERVLPCASILIVSYGSVHKYVWPRFDLVVYDEAQYIKNPGARRSKHSLAIQGDHYVATTGTPMENRPLDAFNILHKLAPETYPDRIAYGYRYCAGWGDKGEYDFSGASNLDEWRAKALSTCMLRRLKKDVLPELPKKIRQVVELPADGKTLKREAPFMKVVLEMEEAYRRGVRALAQTRKDAFENIAKARHETALAKLPQALEFIEDALEQSDKIVIFAWHIDVIEALAKNLVNYQPILLYGKTPDGDRFGLVKWFQEDSSKRVFIANYVVGGTGITLTAANHAIFVEHDFVPGKIEQAEDRLDRLGQKRGVLIQHLVLEGSLDAHMIRTRVSKQAILDQALDGQKPKDADSPLDLSGVFENVEN